MHVRKRKRSLFPAIHQSNKSSLHLDVTEAPRSETESPFLYCSNILSCGYKAGKWTSSWIQWGTASEGSPALWWWSWKLHHSLVWPISPDNSLWGTYRRMGQDLKKRVLNISVLGEYSIITSIIFCMVQVSLASQETPVTISRRILRGSFLVSLIPMGQRRLPLYGKCFLLSSNHLSEVLVFMLTLSTCCGENSIWGRCQIMCS